MQNVSHLKDRAPLVLAPLALVLLGGCSTDPDRPDVVLVVVDTLRADALGIHGATPDPAPFLSSLAREGTVFEQAQASSSWTAPATTSLLTGLYPSAHRITLGFFAQASTSDTEEQLELSRIPEEVPLLAERFARAGYRTVGLASNVNIGPEMGFDRGFDTFERHDGESAGKLLQRLPDLGVRLGTGEPVFLYLHLNDPHYPYWGRPRFYDEPEELPEDETAAEVLRRRALYASEIGLVDDSLRTALLSIGFGPGTLFAFTSDHGEEFQDHGGWFHLFSLYGELTRIPLFVHGPGLGIGRGRVEFPVSSVDLAPTLAQLCDLAPARERDGRSLAPLLGSKWEGVNGPLRERSLFAHRVDPATGRQMWSVVRGNWKWIEHEDGSGELFDMEADPAEVSDRSGEHRELAAELALEIATHRDRVVERTTQKTRVEVDQALYERLQSLGYTR